MPAYLRNRCTCRWLRSIASCSRRIAARSEACFTQSQGTASARATYLVYGYPRSQHVDRCRVRLPTWRSTPIARRASDAWALRRATATFRIASAGARAARSTPCTQTGHTCVIAGDQSRDVSGHYAVLAPNLTVRRDKHEPSCVALLSASVLPQSFRCAPVPSAISLRYHALPPYHQADCINDVRVIMASVDPYT
jgi:hypothetical protein